MAAPGWQTRLQAVWWRTEPPPPWPLRWLSRLFGRVVAHRREAFRDGRQPIHRLDVPVIVVGNRIVGGAGKTPTTLALLTALQAAGWHPGVVSRGHGRSGDEVLEVLPSSPPAQTGDEPLLIARHTGVPVWVGRQRAAAAVALRAAHPRVDVIVCDDGLQHLALGRDIEIVVFDDRGAGNGHLLPAGPLREAIDAPSTAQHHWVLYNAAAPSTPLPGALAERSLLPPRTLAAWRNGDGPCGSWEDWRGRSAWAMAGIGAPERFFADLRRRAVDLPASQTLPMPDHVRYDTLTWPPSVVDLLVTEKDAVKLDPERLLQERPHTQVWVVPMHYALPQPFVERLLQALAQVHPTPR